MRSRPSHPHPAESDVILAKAIIAFVALPGIVAYAAPIAWLRATERALVMPWGLAILVVGSVGLLWCVRDFFVAGKGTLAPWAPPTSLVVIGLYRYSRNPMYVSVVTIVLGWAIAFGSLALLGYAIVVAFAFHLRVVRGEEPWLARVHGARWAHYAGRVRRWL